MRGTRSEEVTTELYLKMYILELCTAAHTFQCFERAFWIKKLLEWCVLERSSKYFPQFSCLPHFLIKVCVRGIVRVLIAQCPVFNKKPIFKI